jgi:hypothetical protein
MALPQKQQSARWQAWLQGGGLFVAVSLGLHWAVLQIPLPEEPGPEVRVTLEPTDTPTETIDVVRVPPSALEPEPEPTPQPAPQPVQQAPRPSLVAQAPIAPVAPRQPQVEARQESPQAAAKPDVPEPSATATPDPEATRDPTPTPESDANPEDPAPQFNGQTKSVEVSELGFSMWYYDQPWALDYPLSAIELPPLQITYAPTACLSPDPEPGLLTVFLNPDGSQADDPIVVNSTGYDPIDDQALAAFEEYDAAAAINSQAQEARGYALQVEVNYDPAGCSP